MTKPAARYDGWANFFSGLGVRGRDPRQHDVVGAPREFTRTELNWLYRSDAIAARAIDVLPDDATRQGFRLGFDDGDPEDASKIGTGVNRYMRKLGAKKEVRRGLSLGRLHGGAVAVLGLADGLRLDQPVAKERIQSIQWVRLLSRWYVVRGPNELDPKSPHFGTPSKYTVTQLGGSPQSVDVHPDRVIVFPGSFNPETLHTTEMGGLGDGWDDSVITRMWQPLSRFEAGYASLARVSTDFSRATYTIEGLARLMASGKEEQVRRRIEIAELSMSLLNAVLLDPKESFQFNTRPLTGYSDLLDHLGVYLAAATGMPVTRLLGVSPGGFGTGTDEDRRWDDVTMAYQDEVLRPVLERLLEYVFLAKDGPTGGKVPPGWDLEFNPLSTPDPKQEAEIRKLISDAMVAQVNSGILLDEEAAQAMHGGARFGMDVVLDEEARSALQRSAEAGQALEGGAPPEDIDAELGRTRGGGNPDDAPPVRADALEVNRRNVLNVLSRIHDNALEPDVGARFLNRFHGIPLDEARSLVGLAA